jgi:hypothetical protein
VTHSLRAADVEAPTSERRKPSTPRSRSASTRKSRWCEGWVLTRGDRTSLIELMAARYAVPRQLVGELSFHVTARRFISSEPPIAPVPSNFGDNFPRFIRSLDNAACVEYAADVAELEMRRHKARHVPHTQPLTALALSFSQVERLIGLCGRAWENNKTSKDSRLTERWVAEKWKFDAFRWAAMLSFTRCLKEKP